jgi:hypothetical protein
LYLAHRLLVRRCALHSDEKVILILDQEYYDALVKAVLFGGHCVSRMRQHAGLEDSRQILRVHPVLIRLGREYGKEIKDVEKKLAIQRRQLGNELLIPRDGAAYVEVVDELWPLGIRCCLPCRTPQWFAEFLIQIQRYHWFGEIVEISPEHVGRIVYGITIPHKALAIAVGRVENRLQLFDTFFRSAETENTLHPGS